MRGRSQTTIVGLYLLELSAGILVIEYTTLSTKFPVALLGKLTTSFNRVIELQKLPSEATERLYFSIDSLLDTTKPKLFMQGEIPPEVQF